MTSETPSIPPVRRSVSVSWSPEAAFRRFTAEFGTWWPSLTHSIGGTRVQHIGFECREGGRIFEELKDGRRFQWGKLTAWEPPSRVAFSWHPSHDESEAQDVEVRFVPEGTGTRVELTSTGWERLGAKGRRAQRMYNVGWGSVLDTFAGRKSAALVVFGVISTVATFFLWMTGKLDSSIDRAGGRMDAGVTRD